MRVVLEAPQQADRDRFDALGDEAPDRLARALHVVNHRDEFHHHVLGGSFGKVDALFGCSAPD